MVVDMRDRNPVVPIEAGASGSASWGSDVPSNPGISIKSDEAELALRSGYPEGLAGVLDCVIARFNGGA
jgi:hypothetical protein